MRITSPRRHLYWCQYISRSRSMYTASAVPGFHQQSRTSSSPNKPPAVPVAVLYLTTCLSLSSSLSLGEADFFISFYGHIHERSPLPLYRTSSIPLERINTVWFQQSKAPKTVSHRWHTFHLVFHRRTKHRILFLLGCSWYAETNFRVCSFADFDLGVWRKNLILDKQVPKKCFKQPPFWNIETVLHSDMYEV